MRRMLGWLGDTVSLLAYYQLGYSAGVADAGVADAGVGGMP